MEPEPPLVELALGKTKNGQLIKNRKKQKFC
jgi:hypothetical protein